MKIRALQFFVPHTSPTLTVQWVGSHHESHHSAVQSMFLTRHVKQQPVCPAKSVSARVELQHRSNVCRCCVLSCRLKALTASSRPGSSASPTASSAARSVRWPAAANWEHLVSHTYVLQDDSLSGPNHDPLWLIWAGFRNSATLEKPMSRVRLRLVSIRWTG